MFLELEEVVRQVWWVGRAIRGRGVGPYVKPTKKVYGWFNEEIKFLSFRKVFLTLGSTAL